MALVNIYDNQTILFIDPSAQHLAYCFVDFDFKNMEAFISGCGMIWTKASWTKGQRFHYMNNCFNLLMKGLPGFIPNMAVTEQFFMNPKLRSGVAVVPSVNALLEMNCSIHNIDYGEIPPPSWRSELNIKAIKLNGKRDYKQPTKEVVENFIGSLPEEIKSNVTLKPRSTPSDISDVLAISLAHIQNMGFKKIDKSNILFIPYNIIEALNKEIENI